MNLLHGERLRQVHPDLIKLVYRAAIAAPWDLLVIEGIRTVERQKVLFAQGASKTMNSRHIPGVDGLGKAVDIAPAPGGQASWAWPLYHILAPVVKAAAVELKIPIEWGGDWATFADGPHWQLPHAKYP